MSHVCVCAQNGREIEESVRDIRDAYGRWQKLLAESPNSPEYVAAGQALLLSIADTDADLQDLAETVVVVENNRDRFRITDAELAARRQFLADTKAELARIAADVQSPDTERRASANARAVCIPLSPHNTHTPPLCVTTVALSQSHNTRHCDAIPSHRFPAAADER